MQREMRLVITLVLVLAACGETRQVHRWPNHRREKDEQIAAVAQKAIALETKTMTLEARIRMLVQHRRAPRCCCGTLARTATCSTTRPADLRRSGLAIELELRLLTELVAREA